MVNFVKSQLLDLLESLELSWSKWSVLIVRHLPFHRLRVVTLREKQGGTSRFLWCVTFWRYFPNQFSCREPYLVLLITVCWPPAPVLESSWKQVPGFTKTWYMRSSPWYMRSSPWYMRSSPWHMRSSPWSMHPSPWYMMRSSYWFMRSSP